MRCKRCGRGIMKLRPNNKILCCDECGYEERVKPELPKTEEGFVDIEKLLY